MGSTGLVWPLGSILVDGSAPGQVTDMSVVFRTPAWVLEIAGKSHQTRPQTIILTVIDRGLCAAVTSPTHAGK